MWGWRARGWEEGQKARGCGALGGFQLHLKAQRQQRTKKAHSETQAHSSQPVY